MAGRTRIELPPALETRPTNKSRVVGAPDMPKPRRSPAEVQEAKAQKKEAKNQVEKKKQGARQRVQTLKAGLSEDSPTQTEPPPASAFSVQDDSEALEADQPHHQSLKIVLPPSRRRGYEASQTALFEEGDEQAEEFIEPEDSHEYPAPAGHGTDSDEDGDSSFEPMDEDELDEDRSGDEGDADEHTEKSKKKKRAAARRAPKAAQAVGKRKQDDMGESERATTKSTAGPAAKKPRQNHGSHAPTTNLVPNWMEVISRQPRGRSATPATSTSTSIPNSVSTSRSPSRPPSSLSGGDSSEHEESPEPIPLNVRPESPIANVSDALRYRAKAHPVFSAPDELAADFNAGGTSDLSGRAAPKTSHEPRSASRVTPAVPVSLTRTSGPAAITHALTKIVAPSRIPGEPSPDTRSSSSGSTKKTRKRAGKGSENVSGTGKADSESKSVTLRNIPQSMQTLFTERFVPLTRQFAGTLDPWQEVTLNELKTLYLQAFGDLAHVHPLNEGDKCHKLIQQKLNDWRAKFATTGGETFKEIIASDPDLIEWFTNLENVGAYATYLLGDGKGAAPFYYAQWNDGVQKIGRMRSPLIVGILAHHISELHTVNAKDRTGDLPRGALCMAVLAAIHTLTHYQTGEWAPPSGRAGWFSADNYSDRMYWDANRQRERSDKKVTNILKVIDDLSGDEWLEIVEEARKVMNTRRATSGRRSKAGKGSTAAVPPAEAAQEGGPGAGDSDSDEGLMLVNDA